MQLFREVRASSSLNPPFRRREGEAGGGGRCTAQDCPEHARKLTGWSQGHAQCSLEAGKSRKAIKSICERGLMLMSWCLLEGEEKIKCNTVRSDGAPENGHSYCTARLLSRVSARHN